MTVTFCKFSYHSLSQRMTSYDNDDSNFCDIFRTSKERAMVPYIKKKYCICI